MGDFRRSGVAFAARGILLGTVAFAGLGAISIPYGSKAQVPAEASAPIAPAPVPAWSVGNAQKLVKAIEASKDEGLRPADYNLAALRRAIAQGPGSDLDTIAQAAALTLAHDYWLGRVADRTSMDWHIARPEGGAMLPGELAQALQNGKVEKFYASLLPRSDRYEALKAAYAGADDAATRDRIRANMERWRWMPRTMGDDYLFVNVPSYHLQLVNDGQVQSTYTVVVGAPDTPTPQLASTAPSLVVNPWWNVPVSIVKKSGLRAGSKGFVYASNGSGVRQPPGPKNALGKLKINLTDTPAIYLHDTNAKSAFNRDKRDLSHGCVRVKDIDQLASELMRDGGDDMPLQEALADTDTRTMRLPKQWEVYLVYFTMDQDETGTLRTYGDPYGRDAKLLALLDGGAKPGLPMTVASN